MLPHFVLHCVSIHCLCSQPYLLATRLLVLLPSLWQQSTVPASPSSIMFQSWARGVGGSGWDVVERRIKAAWSLRWRTRMKPTARPFLLQIVVDPLCLCSIWWNKTCVVVSVGLWGTQHSKNIMIWSNSAATRTNSCQNVQRNNQLKHLGHLNVGFVQSHWTKIKLQVWSTY